MMGEKNGIHLDALWRGVAEFDRPMTRDRAIRQEGDPRGWPEYLHDVAWAATEADGKTVRIGCSCGFEGTADEFQEHMNGRPWTDDEIVEADDPRP